mmetsp:Transcript_31258/g.41352  ORF Transcript_31258/g.41352 Transcript_31258/m.41352 type:complete len:197 (-) Transcript_31258:107-697(-)
MQAGGKSAEFVGKLLMASSGKIFISYLMVAAIPFIISSTMMGLYWGLFSDAAYYNDNAGASMNKDTNTFDWCGITTPSMSGITFGDTKWTVVFTLNAITYTLLTVFTIALALSAFAWPLAFCGCAGACCSQMLHLATIIVTGVFRYSKDGEKCAEQAIPINENKLTFVDVGDRMQGLFIAQCVLFCFYGCCLGFLL